VVLRSRCVVLYTVCKFVSDWHGHVRGWEGSMARRSRALFRDELPFFVEGMYIVLFIWCQKGSVSEWFEDGHCFVYGSVFMPVVESV